MLQMIMRYIVLHLFGLGHHIVEGKSTTTAPTTELRTTESSKSSVASTTVKSTATTLSRTSVPPSTTFTTTTTPRKTTTITTTTSTPRKTTTTTTTTSTRTTTTTTTTTSSMPIVPRSEEKNIEEVSFLHLSDLHISDKRDYSRKNLESFCENVFPQLVAGKDILFLAITGDFTDGFADFFSLGMFGQQESDWKHYKQAIQGCAKTGVPILSVRGNHDSYDVASFYSDSNKWFRELQSELSRSLSRNAFEKSIHKETGSFAITHKASQSRFAFIEASRIIPAPHQYHGEFSLSQEVWLTNWIEGPSNNVARKTYVFTHYPLGSLVPDSRARLLSAVANSDSRVVYLSGHIHSLLGRNGVQALKSHDKVDELQVADFKWSGIVRKVHIPTSLFVDIPTIGVKHDSLIVAASVLIDPETAKPVMSLYSNRAVFVVKQCESSAPLKRHSEINDVHLFEAPQTPCISVTTLDGVVEVVPVETRLPSWTLARSFFAHFFEWIQLIVLAEYILLILVARQIFRKSPTQLFATIYLVLSPIVPNIVFEGVYGKPYILANSVAMIDLETREIILDSDTTRVAFMLLMYLVLATGLFLKPHFGSRAHFGYIFGSLLMLLFSLVDFRINLARGGLRCLALSPHTWFILYAWFLWLRAPPSKPRDKME